MTSTRKTWYRVDTDDKSGEELVVRKRTINQPAGFHATIELAREAYAPSAQQEKPPAQVIKPTGVQSEESVHAGGPAKMQDNELTELRDNEVPAALKEKYPLGLFAARGSTIVVDNYGKVRQCVATPATLDKVLADLRKGGIVTNATKLHKVLINIATLDPQTGKWGLRADMRRHASA